MAGVARGLGLFCVVAALALLIIVCNATPSWNAIYFVRVDAGLAGEARLGLYGASYRIARGSWTAIGSQLGYGDNDLPDFLGDGLDILYSVTVAMGVMHPLTAAVVLLAALFSFGGFILSVIGAILAFLGFLLALICLALDAALSVVARNSINNALPGDPASIGKALWLMIPVPILLLVSSVTVCIGTHRAHRRRRDRRNGVVIANSTGVPVSEKPQGVVVAAPKRKWWQRKRY